jgi:hypothetical protein
MDIDINDAIRTAVIGLAVVLSVSEMAGCAEHQGTESTKEQIAFIERGCKKITVLGSQGTHWVCGNANNFGSSGH